MGLTVAAFKAARLFSPTKVDLLHPDATSVDHLRAFPFLHDEELSGLKEELPNYLAKVSDVAPDIDPLEWWKHHEKELPKWASTLRKVLLVQPSSAGAERFFFRSCLTRSDTNKIIVFKTTLRLLLCYNTTTINYTIFATLHWVYCVHTVDFVMSYQSFN